MSRTELNTNKLVLTWRTRQQKKQQNRKTEAVVQQCVTDISDKQQQQSLIGSAVESYVQFMLYVIGLFVSLSNQLLSNY